MKMPTTEELLLLYGNYKLNQIEANTAMAALPDSVREEMYWQNTEMNVRKQLEEHLWSQRSHYAIDLGYTVGPIVIFFAVAAGCASGEAAEAVFCGIIFSIIWFAMLFLIKNLQRQKLIDSNSEEIANEARNQIMTARTSMKMNKIMHKELAKEGIKRAFS
jgi:hypothetical protein